MITYPIMLDLHGQRCVVVGAGEVGLRKVASLKEAGANITLVTGPEAPADLAGRDELAGTNVVRQSYRREQLAGARLVFACTDDRRLNDRIATEARRAGALVNAADQPEDCDFYLPAVARHGQVVLAVGTGGAAPRLAAALRDRLNAAMPPRLAEYAELLAGIRRRLRRQGLERQRRSEVMNALAEPQALEAFLSEGEAAVERMVHEILSPR